MSLDYAKSGVDIDAGNRFIDSIKTIIKSTHRKGVVGSIGGFGGAFKIPAHYKNPLLISATDGVGTKLKLAIEYKQHQSIGIDLVAMCVNDLITCGAEPLFFLDYLSTGKLDLPQAQQIIEGVCSGCRQANCALVGGETAEMPGIYQGDDFDLAGFCVGVVEQEEMIEKTRVQANDVIIGLASSGIHSNGYSLVRKIMALDSANQQLDNSLKEVLLTPTTIYVASILELTQQTRVNGIAHITGGGLIENVSRVLPQGLSARIDMKSWQRPEIFNWLQDQGQVTEEEMWRVFNQGIGMVVMVSPQEVETSMAVLSCHQPKLIGSVVKTPQSPPSVELY